MKNVLLLFALLFSLTVAPAQTKDISGTVVNEKSEAIAGALVKVKGASASALTDDNGSFSLAGVADTATLVITSGGYQELEINVADKTILSITLVRSAAANGNTGENTAALINFNIAAFLSFNKQRLSKIR